MAVGKNKRISKGKKGGKRKIIDPFTRKDWYDIRAPSLFANRDIGKTIVNRTQGTRIATDALKGRVLEANLADLQGVEEQAYRNFRFVIDDIQGKQCLTNFYGMKFTTDKLRSLVRKWQSLIEAHVDVKTIDGYTIRLFAIAFTRKVSPVRKTCYAQTSKIRLIRKKMMEILIREASTVDLKELVQKFLPNSIEKIMAKECERYYPLKDVYIRKVKILKAPKLDVHKLWELHEFSPETSETGAKV